MSLIEQGDYTLFLDEELDVIKDFNKLRTTEDNPRQQVTAQDIKRLKAHNMISVDEHFKVHWTDEEQTPDGKDYEVMRMAELGRLYCARDKLLVVIYPPEMFRLYNDVYVLTYLFDGSPLQYYFQLFGLEYELASVTRDNNGKYKITEYTSDADIEFRNKFVNLVTICDKQSLHRKRTLSKSWYSNADKQDLKQIGDDIRNFFDTLKPMGLTKQNVMWCCPSEFENKIKPKGYIKIRELTDEEKKLPVEELRTAENKTKCYVSFNAKATNIYRDRWALVYCCNMFYHTMIRGLFEDSGIFIKQKHMLYLA